MRYELSTNKIEKLPGPVNAEEPVGYTITHDPGPVVMGDYNDKVTTMGQQWFEADKKTDAAKAPSQKAPGTSAPAKKGPGKEHSLDQSAHGGH
jgi:hypothetical protein